MRLAAVCAIYGGYDLIPPVPDGVDDAVLVTDVPVRSGWRNVVEPSASDPRLAAKWPKARPDLYTDCDASLWIDGSIHVHDDRFVELVRAKLETHDLVLLDHPEDRDCLHQEAEHCAAWGRWPAAPLREQAQYYLSQGMPRNFGLWAATMIARRHSPRIQRLGDDWLSEIERWTIRDQISLPYLLWREAIVPETFGIDQLDNDMVSWMPHAQELRDHRRTVVSLEAEIIRLGGEVAWLRSEWRQEQERYARLRQRRIVRAALFLARPLRPFLSALRALRRR